MIGCVRLLRPKDGEIRPLVRKNVIDEHVRQVLEPTPGKGAGTVERIRSLPILESLNRSAGRRVTVVIGEGQRARVVGVDGVPRKGIPRLLELFREAERHRRILIEDDAPALVILDESRPELADGCCRQPLGLRRLKHRRDERELAAVRFPHGFDDPEVLDERRGGKIDFHSLRVLSPRTRCVHHVAVEPMHPRIRSSRNGRGVHHGEGRIYGVVIREHDPRSSESEVVRHVFRSYVVSSKSIPNKDDDSSRSCPCVPLLCSETASWSEHKER